MENYLSRCIESILAQTYSDIELILINDGSTDKSLNICEEYVKKDCRIKLINQSNQGVAEARNRGMEAATGTYIAFVDPDDWIEANMYESLYRQLKAYKTEVCLCDFFKDTKVKSVAKHFEFKEELLNKEEIIGKLINNMIGIEEIGFKSNTDVLDFVVGNSYSHDGITLRITDEAVYANDNKISTSKPVFRKISLNKGIITARPSISITVVRDDNRLVDNNNGDSYYY